MRYSIEAQFGGFRGIEFFVDESKVDRAYIEDQLDALNADIKSGVLFDEGIGEMTIGWVTLDLVKNDAGYLQIREPNFFNFPIIAWPQSSLARFEAGTNAAQPPLPETLEEQQRAAKCKIKI
jgi:hypothetical protein